MNPPVSILSPDPPPTGSAAHLRVLSWGLQLLAPSLQGRSPLPPVGERNSSTHFVFFGDLRKTEPHLEATSPLLERHSASFRITLKQVIIEHIFYQCVLNEYLKVGILKAVLGGRGLPVT